MSSPGQIAERIAGLMRAPAVYEPGEEQAERAYLAGNAWRYAAILRRIDDLCGGALAGRAVLDLGAYPGHLSAMLGRDGARVTAVTLVSSPAFGARMTASGVTAGICDVEREALPADDASVDLVLCFELIEHLEGDVLHMLREVRRVLRPAAPLLLTTPNHAAVSRRWDLVRGRSVYPPLDDPVYPFYAGAGRRNPWRHMREFTVAEIESLLRQAGFRRSEVSTISPPWSRAGLGFRGTVAAALIAGIAACLRAGGHTIVAIGRS